MEEESLSSYFSGSQQQQQLAHGRTGRCGPSAVSTVSTQRRARRAIVALLHVPYLFFKRRRLYSVISSPSGRPSRTHSLSRFRRMGVRPFPLSFSTRCPVVLLVAAAASLYRSRGVALLIHLISLDKRHQDFPLDCELGSDWGIVYIRHNNRGAARDVIFSMAT